MFETAFADHVNLVLIGTSEKVVSVQVLPASAFASAQSQRAIASQPRKSKTAEPASTIGICQRKSHQEIDTKLTLGKS